jgi:hypothetical protein
LGTLIRQRGLLLTLFSLKLGSWEARKLGCREAITLESENAGKPGGWEAVVLTSFILP